MGDGGSRDGRSACGGVLVLVRTNVDGCWILKKKKVLRAQT